MAKKTAKPQEQLNSVFENFVEHERKALAETSRAFATFVPEDMRQQGRKLYDEYGQNLNSFADTVLTLERDMMDEVAKAASVMLPEDAREHALNAYHEFAQGMEEVGRAMISHMNEMADVAWDGFAPKAAE